MLSTHFLLSAAGFCLIGIGAANVVPLLGYIASRASLMVALGMLSLSGLVIALSAGIIKRGT